MALKISGADLHVGVSVMSVTMLHRFTFNINWN